MLVPPLQGQRTIMSNGGGKSSGHLRFDVDAHFSAVAPRYRDVRTTDREPVEAIAACLSALGRALCGADIGCGTGRYTELLHARLPAGSLTVAADRSLAMLRHRRPVQGVYPLRCSAEAVPLADGSADWLTSFNSVHHFDLGGFLVEAARVLRSGGYLWIYTRTPEQNARTVWGRLFPDFTEKETRLRPVEAYEAAVGANGRLVLEEVREFEYPRQATREELLERAEAAHYSTFRCYGEREFAAALAAFAERLPEREPVEWTDANVLIRCRRR